MLAALSGLRDVKKEVVTKPQRVPCTVKLSGTAISEEGL
jgi:hypothetical protein